MSEHSNIQSSRSLRARIFAAICAVGIVADQASKAFMSATLTEGSRPFIPGLMEFRLVHNTGAAFSLGQGMGYFFIVIAFLVCAACAYEAVVRKNCSVALCCSLACVCAGGLGNVIDRIRLGFVVDFLATTFIDFPVFNIADILVTCGVAVSVVLMFLLGEDEVELDSLTTASEDDVHA